ncbi:MAG TPA: hypothetical protein VK612_09145 [Pyrinomonadaceae bacterium]|nr:hypothetical protein [Pyrinomonadaceae bacterium]
MLRAILLATLILGSHMAVSAQKVKTEAGIRPDFVVHVRSSPAWAEILLRRTELEADLESLILEYTEDFPKVKESRYELEVLNKYAATLLLIKPAESSKLTLALGKLLVRKADIETDLWKLQQSYADGHPDVKRAKRRLEIYEKAIKEILG